MHLEADALTCFDWIMSTTLIEVRPAKAADAAAVASTHDEAWRSAYQGIIPGAELEKLINRRGPQWWDSAIRRSEEHTSELQSRPHLVCRLLLEKKNSTTP